MMPLADPTVQQYDRLKIGEEDQSLFAKHAVEEQQLTHSETSGKSRAAPASVAAAVPGCCRLYSSGRRSESRERAA